MFCSFYFENEEKKLAKSSGMSLIFPFRPAFLPRAIIDVDTNGLSVQLQSVQLFHRLLHPSAGRKIDVARLVAALPAPVLGQPQVPFSMHEVGDFSPFDRGRQIVDDEAILVRFSFIRRRLPAL